VKPDDWVKTVGAAFVILGSIVGWWRGILPKLRESKHERKSIAHALLGRPAIPANPITGEDARPAILPLGQQVMELRELIDQTRTTQETQGVEIRSLSRKVDLAIHELTPNSGKSLADKVNRTADFTQKIAEANGISTEE
jgi:hypothetical protein